MIRALSPVKVRSRHCAASDQCPLYPRERTLEFNRVMSALCQKRTFCAAAELALFDHFVGAGEQRWRHPEAERLRSDQVDD